MNITYKNPGYDHSIDSISLFLTGDETPFWSEPIFHFYPQVDKHALSNCKHTEKHKYLNDVFRDIYENLREEIDKKVICYNAHFQNHKGQIEDALSDAFGVDASTLFNDLTGNVILNPICPRFFRPLHTNVLAESAPGSARTFGPKQVPCFTRRMPQQEVIAESKKQVWHEAIPAFWSKWRDSNSRHPAPKAGALPTALHLDTI